MKIQHIQRYKGVLAAIGTAALISISSAQGRDRDIDAFNTTMEGRGTVRVDGRSFDFNRLQVTLQDNDRITLHAMINSFGGRDVTMTGRVQNRRARGGSIRADINSVTYGRDVDRADADCVIDITSRNRFESVKVTGRNTSERNGISLNFDSKDRGWGNGRDRDDDRDWDRDNGRRTATGHYTDNDAWTDRGDHFKLSYKLELDRNGRAKLTAKSEDRNMPNGRRSFYAHGEILDHLVRGHDVVQTGRWSQDGNEVTVTFDRIEYGRTERSQREVLKGRIRNGNIWFDQYDEGFYGHRNDMSFEKVGLFR